MKLPALPGMLKNRTLGELAVFAASMLAAAMDPAAVATVIEFESARTWSPSVKNPTSGATGLIQFMPKTAEALGTSTSELAQMSFAQQLSFVVKHFRSVGIAKLKRLVDYYAAVFWPAAVGTDDSFVIAKAGSVAYEANKVLDPHGNGQITTGDLSAAMQAVQASAKGTIDIVPSFATGLVNPRKAGIAVAGLLVATGIGVLVWRLRR